MHCSAEDAAEGDPEHRNGAVECAENGAVHRAETGDIEKLDEENFPAWEGNVVDSIGRGNGGGDARCLGAENALHPRSASKISGNQDEEADAEKKSSVDVHRSQVMIIFSTV